jgi:hypothetical protein
MSLFPPITIVLQKHDEHGAPEGVARRFELRWTKRAEARNSSLPRPISWADLARRKRSYYALLAVVWAALNDRDREFEAPEDLAEFIATEDQQVAAMKAIRAMLAEAYPEKKTEPQPNTSPTGPGTSSSSASAPASTHGI